MFHVRQNGVMTEKLKKKLLDREVPYNQIPPADRELYHLAEAKEWADWRANGSVRILSTEESASVRRTTDPRRIIRLRFVYRDKNSHAADATPSQGQGEALCPGEWRAPGTGRTD